MNRSCWPMEQKRAFSAPGKALLVGGYLVLDPKYKAYVVALSARMHAVVSTIKLSEGRTTVTVTSSQFNNDCWSYTIDNKKGFNPISRDGRRNPFIEMVIFNVFNYFQPSSEILDIKISIFSDSGYHSQTKSILKRNDFKEFAYHSSTISEVPKTGLGSSAGLATVVTAALASVFKPSLNVNDIQDLTMIHSLAQVAHCQAQGKVGSGFDVAAATYGSIIYQRFPPELISNLPKHDSGLIYQEKLKALVDEQDWQITADRIRLPDGLRLIMGDVNSGSETTKLVAKVNSWYRSHLPQSLNLYESMNSHNMEFINMLAQLNYLSTNDPTMYKKMIETIVQGDANRIDKIAEFASIRSSVNGIREGFRLITKESGAAIEPEVQTEVLDACGKLKGVLTALIPGAGGYDAISLIATENADLQSQTKFDETFKNVTWLDLKQADIGLMEENPQHYQGFQ